MAQIGFKVQLQVNDGAEGAFSAFDGLTIVTLPDRERGEAEVTNHSQATDSKDFDPLLSDEGTLEVECLYRHAQLARLHSLYNSGLKYEWLVTAPPGTAAGRYSGQTFRYVGFVKKIEKTAFEREGILMNKFSVRATARPVLTAGVDVADD